MRRLTATFSVVLLLAACAAPPVSSPPVRALTETAPGPTTTVEATELATEPPSAQPDIDLSPPSSGEPLSAEGSWMVFKGGTTLWVMNADGSGLRQIDPQNVVAYMGVASPDGAGALLAYTTATGDFLTVDPKLHIVSLPDLKELATITLVSEETADTGPSSENGPRNFQIGQAVVSNLAWSPDGQQLAFVGAMEGTSADIYTYAPQTGAIVHLTGDEYQANQLLWSPDSQIIISLSVVDFGFGGGHEFDSLWATRADGQGSNLLLGNEVMKNYGDFQYHGWMTDTLLVYKIGDDNFNALNVLTGETAKLTEGSTRTSGLSPSGRMLFGGNETYDESGLSLLASPTGSRVKISDEPVDRIEWWPEATLFAVGLGDGDTDNRIMFVDESGAITGTYPLQLRNWSLAPDDTHWASYGVDGEPGLWVEGIDGSSKQVFDQGVMGVTWSPDGMRLFWSGYDGFYTAQAPSYEVTPIAAGFDLMWLYEFEPIWLP